ncbi:MAG: hypothetical protein ACTHU0_15770 [Kofleriaceae bacterium]
MSRRSLGLGVALAAALIGGCYDVPQPNCGFLCGPRAACPEDYTCSAVDNRCHLNGSPADLVCPTYDAPRPVDAPESDALPDAPIDAPPDAPIDAPIDAA